MKTNPVLDIIISLLENTVYHFSGRKRIAVFENVYNGRVYGLGGADYLLGQVVRQYYIDESRYYISQKAKSLWDSISRDDIWKYSYRDIVKCQNRDGIEVKEYVGASSRFTTRILEEGTTFVFNNVFHDEHIVPICAIVKELQTLSNPNYENVSAVLEKLCVCRMLKEEDRSIAARYKRPNSFDEIIDTIYKKSNIELIKRKAARD